MFSLSNCFIIILLLSSSVCVLDSKTDEDEAKKLEGDPTKNFTTHENTLAPRPQTSSSQPSSSQPLKQIECKDNNSQDISPCPSGVACNKLGGDCLDCDFNCSCIYGQPLNVSCSPKKDINCEGSRTFTREMMCRYCYQTPQWEHTCAGTADCPSVSSPRKMFKTNCSVKSEMLCLGSRHFPKRVPCNWTSGYQWKMALILSITLGGFGADRFYLGHWQEGIGKLFSFGGLGVWTIIDVILIAIRYLGPANESLYI